MRTFVSVAAGLVVLAGTAFAQDVLKVSPATNKLLVDNQYVRVLESTFRPGAREPLHTHPAGWY
jgi:quercetin dioxygenase-like cupin family protein